MKNYEVMIEFDYTTGTIKRDFKIVSWDRVCKLMSLPCYVGSKRCKKCKHYDGSYMYHGFWIFCKHPEQKDTENFSVVDEIYSKFRAEALSQL